MEPTHDPSERPETPGEPDRPGADQASAATPPGAVPSGPTTPPGAWASAFPPPPGASAAPGAAWGGEGLAPGAYPGGPGAAWGPGYPPGPGGPQPPGAWTSGPGGWGSGGHDPYWDPQAPRRGSLSVAITALLVAVAVLAGVGIGRSLPAGAPAAAASPGTTSPFGSGNPFGSGVPSGGGSSASNGPADVNRIAAKIDRSLVDIEGNLSYQGEEAFGTGIILSSNGLVLTNNHVIDQSTALKITDIATGRSYVGEVVGYDELSDVAVVQMKGASGLTPAPIDTAPVSVGEDVVAVGNAGGRGGTPTPAGGTVIALNQAITATDAGDGTTEHLKGLIETDADIQPGDSGGSLVNTKSQVIGMDTAASSTFSFAQAGVEGFSIPIDTALGIAHQIEAGRASAVIHVGPTAFIGVTVTNTQCVNQADDPVGPHIRSGSGALICSVVPGTAASRSGLAAYDVITSVDGVGLATPSDLTHLLVRYHPGQTAVIGYTTSTGQRHTTNITFGSGPPG